MTIDLAVYRLRQARAVDGDTVAAHLWDDRPIGYGMRLRTYSGRADGGAAEASIRLPWLDTPERGQPGWAEARDQAGLWLGQRIGLLHVVVFGSGGLGRILGDVRTDDEQSLSQYMLGEGWPLWTG